MGLSETAAHMFLANFADCRTFLPDDAALEDRGQYRHVWWYTVGIFKNPTATKLHAYNMFAYLITAHFLKAFGDVS